jgi:hypothetical protein
MEWREYAFWKPFEIAGNLFCDLAAMEVLKKLLLNISLIDEFLVLCHRSQ